MHPSPELSVPLSLRSPHTSDGVRLSLHPRGLLWSAECCLCPGASCSAVRSWLYFCSGWWLKVAWQSVCCRRCSWVKVRSAWLLSFLPLFVDTSHGNRSYPDAIVSRGLCRSRVPLENCQNWIYRTLVNKGPPNGHNECFGLCLASIFVPNSRASRIKPKVSVEILKC